MDSPFLRKLVMKRVQPKYIFRLLFGFNLMVSAVISSPAQEKKLRKTPFIAYPLAFYSPETKAGIGVAGTINFKSDLLDSLTPASQVSLGFAYTQNRQTIFSLPFALYSKHREHTILGEYSYNDFSYYYYGTGPGNEKGVSEKYKVKFPLFRINYYKRISNSIFIGARWWYEDYNIKSFESNELLLTKTPGRSGGTTSGPGIVFLFDTRDNLYYSLKGDYLELVYQNQSSLTGSDFFYDRYRFDYRHFHPINKNQSVCFQAFGDFISGNVPFNQMPGIGAGRRGRGFYEGRFRDKNIILLQGEWRARLDNKLSAALFFNSALLAEKASEFYLAESHLSAGCGLRYMFDVQNKTNVRLDIAFPLDGKDYIYNPEGTMKVYFTVNEAF